MTLYYIVFRAIYTFTNIKRLKDRLQIPRFTLTNFHCIYETYP